MGKRDRQERAEVLQARIVSCMEAIRLCEDELVGLGVYEFGGDAPDSTETLWRNFRHVQNGHSDLQRNFGRYEEESCHAVAALLERELLPRPQSGLLLRGCSIQTRDKSALWCISGELDERTREQIRVCNRL
jgi:hypothetical protein